MWLRTSETQWVKTLGAKLDNLTLILGTHIEERTDSHILPSDLHTYTMELACICVYMHYYIHKHTHTHT
jgi:hypothetical protein